MDDEARAYFLAVEDHYQKTIGRPLILSPKDLQAVKSWWQDGIPLEAAKKGITAYLERLERDPTKKRKRRLAVRWAEDEVRTAAETLRTARIGDRRGEGVEDEERLTEVIGDLAEGLEQAATTEAVQELGEATRARLEETAARVRDLHESWEHGEIDADDAEDQLQAWDRELLEALEKGMGEKAHADLRHEAEARLSDMRARMEAKAWQKTVDLLEEKLLRERFAVPRLSLYGY